MAKISPFGKEIGVRSAPYTHKPWLFALSTIQNGFVKDMWNCSILDWDFKPRRSLRNCEHHAQWNEIKRHFKTPNDSRAIDYPTWKLNINGKFFVASVKKVFFSLNQRDDINIDVNIFSQLWKTKIPKKCRFFIWSLLHCCINTADILQRKVSTLNLSSNWCSLCKRHSEEIDHIFIDCHTAKILWNKLEGLQPRAECCFLVFFPLLNKTTQQKRYHHF